MKGKCNLTLFAGDSAAPRGKRRDFWRLAKDVSG